MGVPNHPKKPKVNWNERRVPRAAEPKPKLVQLKGGILKDATTINLVRNRLSVDPAGKEVVIQAVNRIVERQASPAVVLETMSKEQRAVVTSILALIGRNKLNPEVFK